MEAVPAMFAHGLEGYADDRIADRPGWIDFDASAIDCRVIVLHGVADVITTFVHAEHTATIVPGAELRLCEGFGHFSIEDEIVPTLGLLRERPESASPQRQSGSF